jgi:hypothetical protein
VAVAWFPGNDGDVWAGSALVRDDDRLVFDSGSNDPRSPPFLVPSTHSGFAWLIAMTVVICSSVGQRSRRKPSTAG